MPTHLDLCSGIGGFALAAGWNGYTTIGFCEIDPFCQRVLRKHWPETPIHDDLRTLRGADVWQWLTSTEQGIRNYGRTPVEWIEPNGTTDERRTVALVTAGYPCQPFSQAGKRLGEADDRHLWPAIAALVAELQPTQCLFENVAGHVSMGLDGVLADLEALGYACRPVVVPACAVNAPHRRDRVWIMAHAADGGIRRGSASGKTGLAAFGGEVVADSDAFGRRRRENDDRQGTTERDGNPLSSWWATEPELGRVAHGVSNRAHRLRALGNAIVPQVAAEIIAAMRTA